MFLKKPSSCLFLVDYILKRFQPHSKTEWEVHNSRIFPTAPLYIYNLPTIYTIEHSSAFVMVSEPRLTHHYYSKSAIYISDRSWYCTSHGFENCIMTCIHHYSIIHNSFTPLIILCSMSAYPLLSPQTLATSVFVLSLQLCLSQNVIYMHRIVCSLFRLTSFTYQYALLLLPCP